MAFASVDGHTLVLTGSATRTAHRPVPLREVDQRHSFQ
jgi:hypothetical protein